MKSKMQNTMRIRYQIFLIQIIVITLIALITFFSQFTLFYLISEESRQENNQIQLSKYIEKYSYFTIEQYKTSLTRQFNRFQKEIYNCNLLYQFYESHHIYSTFDLVPPPQKPYNSDQFIQFTQFCYGVQTQEHSDPLIIEKFKDFTKLLTISIPQMNVNETYYFTSTSEEQYFSLYPMGQLTGYKPHSRPWYQNHLNQTYQQSYSEPYFDYSPSNGILITLTQSMYNYQKKMIGVAGLDIYMNQFPQLNFTEMTFYIIDTQGRIIISKRSQEQDSSVTYFSNETITGYNQEDLLLVLNNSQYSEGYVKCTKLNLLCLYNKLDNRYYLTQVNSLNISDYFLILQLSSQYYEDLFTTLDQVILDNLKEHSQMFIYFLVISIIVTLGIQLITLNLLEKPITKILMQVRRIIKNQQDYQIQNKILKPSLFIGEESILGQLTTAFNRLAVLFSRQELSQNCLQRYYPLRYASLSFYLRIQNNQDYRWKIRDNVNSQEKKNVMLQIIKRQNDHHNCPFCTNFDKCVYKLAEQ